MKLNFENKRDAAEFVDDLLKAFPNACVSITTTEPGKSEACSVHIVTASSSDDLEETRAKFFSETQVNT